VSDAAPDAPTIRPTAFQGRLLAAPDGVDLALGGGRGGGKSYGIALLFLRHVTTYPGARGLYVRRTHAAVEDFAAILRELFFAAYGNAYRYNANESLFKLPNGSTVELGHLDDEWSYRRYQGRSFSLIAVDEATQYPSPLWVDRLRSNLRAGPGVPTRFVCAGNPGEVGHSWFAARYVFGAPAAWVPFVEKDSKREFILAPSTFDDNTCIDRERYAADLTAAAAGDPALLKAWLRGDWSVVRGMFFASVLDEARVAVDADAWTPRFFRRVGVDGAMREGRYSVPIVMNAPPEERERARGWELFLSHDYGSSAPSVTYVCARSPGARGPDGRWYAPRSLILVDELATNEPGSLTKGLGWTVPILADAIRELATLWGMPRARGVADDACFAKHGHGAGSIADEFAAYGVDFAPARKADRRSGWARMRAMLQHAGAPDRPGLYVSRRCDYFWQTVPYLPHDPRRPDDIDTRAADHGADSCRFACLYDGGPRFAVSEIEGMY
jgi:hypothetical protein